MLSRSAGINLLVMTCFISLPLFLFFIQLSLLFNIIDEIIKLVDHLFNNALFILPKTCYTNKIALFSNHYHKVPILAILAIDPKFTRVHTI
jgi:hypothetical protein